MANKDLANELGITVCAIEKRLGTLKLRRLKRWTMDRDGFLRENYEIMSNAHLAEKLGITEFAVAKKLSRLGLLRTMKKKWSKKKEEFLRENYKKLSIDELSEGCGMLSDYIRVTVTRKSFLFVPH